MLVAHLLLDALAEQKNLDNGMRSYYASSTKNVDFAQVNAKRARARVRFSSRRFAVGVVLIAMNATLRTDRVDCSCVQFLLSFSAAQQQLGQEDEKQVRHP